MIKRLRARFIMFNVFVISCVLIILSLMVYIGSKNDVSLSRLIIIIALSLITVFIASFLISKIALAPIKSSWQKQLDFTADASHELRTPITVIQTNLELIMDNGEETVQSQKKWLGNIYAENKRMTKLVEDLLTLSRADTNQQNLQRQTFLIDEVLQEALIPFEPAAKGKGISLHVTVSPQTSFYGDSDRIKQLVIILLDNALKYTQTSGKVEIILKKNAKAAELIVWDTGPGIEAEHLDKIFDRFYRVSTTRNQNQDGSGLGLSIAKWIAYEHGGSIHVESEIQRGTKFTVTLPLRTGSKS